MKRKGFLFYLRFRLVIYVLPIQFNKYTKFDIKIYLIYNERVR